MSSITVRNLDEAVKNSLRLRAARHCWSMEQEVLQILQQAVVPEQVDSISFAEQINSRFKGLNADARPDADVLNWFAQNTRAAMHISSITQAEILTGIALLPAGKRRTALAAAAEQMFEQDFAGQCLVFDAAARVRQGQPISTEDAQIAAIALASGLSVLTSSPP